MLKVVESVRFIGPGRSDNFRRTPVHHSGVKRHVGVATDFVRNRIGTAKDRRTSVGVAVQRVCCCKSHKNMALGSSFEFR